MDIISVGGPVESFFQDGMCLLGLICLVSRDGVSANLESQEVEHVNKIKMFISLHIQTTDRMLVPRFTRVDLEEGVQSALNQCLCSTISQNCRQCSDVAQDAEALLENVDFFPLIYK